MQQLNVLNLFLCFTIVSSKSGDCSKRGPSSESGRRKWSGQPRPGGHGREVSSHQPRLDGHGREVSSGQPRPDGHGWGVSSGQPRPDGHGQGVESRILAAGKTTAPCPKHERQSLEKSRTHTWGIGQFHYLDWGLQCYFLTNQ